MVLHCQTIEETERAFHAVVDTYTYLENCTKESIEPSKIYSGKFNLRLDPELHSRLVFEAAKHHQSLNNFTTNIITSKLLEFKNTEY